MGKLKMKNLENIEMTDKVVLKPPQPSSRAYQSNEMAHLTFKEVKTSIGIMMFGSTTQGLCLMDFKYRKSFPKIINRIKNYFGKNISYGTTDIIELAEMQLKAYLEGILKSFTVPLDIRGSEFQLKVWKALLDIKYGETVSYMDIAQKIGRPGAVRAVGNANGQNGIAIIVPCHRVIGSDGAPIGYGGGLPIKKKLLKLESGEKGKFISQDLMNFLS
ncbi:cysteine methyltransferase [Candidatus Heimdallarchaeota archaeon B3_Heim]|nr:MAG: cysteine methyltransferase [Candidatus Heimdallarchaeota archaeon B3_Heim]